MGLIQGSINQGISIAGLLYTQTAGFKLKQEEKTRIATIAKKEQEFQATSEKFNVGSSAEEKDKNLAEIADWDVDDTEKEAAAAKINYGYERMQNINKELVDLGSEKAIKRASESTEYNASKARMEEISKANAAERAAKILEAEKEEKRHREFAKYIMEVR